MAGSPTKYIPVCLTNRGSTRGNYSPVCPRVPRFIRLIILINTINLIIFLSSIRLTVAAKHWCFATLCPISSSSQSLIWRGQLDQSLISSCFDVRASRVLDLTRPWRGLSLYSSEHRPPPCRRKNTKELKQYSFLRESISNVPTSLTSLVRLKCQV